MSECKFAVEAFHAYIESIGLSRPAGTLGELKAFKAGAEWQRSLAQAELAELKAELALALKVPSIAAMHTWLDSECAKQNKQLEAELAALKAKAAVPDGHALIPARIELSPEDIACIMFQCGGDEEATEIDEQFNGGVLWVGSLRDDDGSETYGLHIACVECLEEGSTTIAEFEAATAQPQSDGVRVPRELLERVAKPVLFTSQEDSHYDACTELRVMLGGEA